MRSISSGWSQLERGIDCNECLNGRCHPCNDEGLLGDDFGAGRGRFGKERCCRDVALAEVFFESLPNRTPDVDRWQRYHL
jgi:hypothetical protein